MSRIRIDRDGLIEEFQENRSDDLLQDSPARRSLAASDRLIAEKMFIGLVIQGIAEFAPYLVESFTKGYGVKPNPFLSGLTGLIGGKLSDISTVGSPPIEEIAKACVAQIKLNAARYVGQAIPVDEAMQVVAQFDQQVKKMSSESGVSYSYVESIGTDTMRQVTQTHMSSGSNALSIARALDFGEHLSEQHQKELAAAQRLKEIEEARLKAEADRIVEEQRLKELETQQAQHLREESIHNAEADLLINPHIQLTHSPKPKSSYGSFPDESSSNYHVSIAILGHSDPLLPSALNDSSSVPLSGETSNDSNSGCCPCCCVVM